MATHSSVLAWRIPGMGEPGGLPSLGSHRVGHDWRDLAAEASAGTFETCTSDYFEKLKKINKNKNNKKKHIALNSSLLSWSLII